MIRQLRSRSFRTQTSHAFMLCGGLLALASSGCGADWEEPSEEYSPSCRPGT